MEESVNFLTDDSSDTPKEGIAGRGQGGGQSFEDSMERSFRHAQKDWSQYSPLALAFLGDAVFDLAVRELYVKRSNCQAQKLHQRVAACVNARAQCRMIRSLLPELSEAEAAIYRRGRNSKPSTKAKNATIEEYLEATGFEALVGYLYLEKEYGRLAALIERGLRNVGAEGFITV